MGKIRDARKATYTYNPQAVRGRGATRGRGVPRPDDRAPRGRRKPNIPSKYLKQGSLASVNENDTEGTTPTGNVRPRPPRRKNRMSKY